MYYLAHRFKCTLVYAFLAQNTIFDRDEKYMPQLNVCSVKEVHTFL